MRWQISLITLLTLATGCVTARTRGETVLTSDEPFFTARGFILAAHVEPYFESARISMERRWNDIHIRVAVPHASERDLIEVAFQPEGEGTRIEFHRVHIDGYGRRSSCPDSDHLQDIVTTILNRADLAAVESLGSMAIYSQNVP